MRCFRAPARAGIGELSFGRFRFGLGQAAEVPFDVEAKRILEIAGPGAVRLRTTQQLDQNGLKYAYRRSLTNPEKLELVIFGATVNPPLTKENSTVVVPVTVPGPIRLVPQNALILQEWDLVAHDNGLKLAKAGFVGATSEIDLKLTNFGENLKIAADWLATIRGLAEAGNYAGVKHHAQNLYDSIALAAEKLKVAASAGLIPWRTSPQIMILLTDYAKEAKRLLDAANSRLGASALMKVYNSVMDFTTGFASKMALTMSDSYKNSLRAVLAMRKLLASQRALIAGIKSNPALFEKNKEYVAVLEADAAKTAEFFLKLAEKLPSGVNLDRAISEVGLSGMFAGLGVPPAAAAAPIWPMVVLTIITILASTIPMMIQQHYATERGEAFATASEERAAKRAMFDQIFMQMIAQDPDIFTSDAKRKELEKLAKEYSINAQQAIAAYGDTTEAAKAAAQMFLKERRKALGVFAPPEGATTIKETKKDGEKDNTVLYIVGGVVLVFILVKLMNKKTSEEMA